MTGENALAKKIFLKSAESFFIFQRLWKILICDQSLKGGRLCTKKDKEYFVDSMNILGNCYFEQNRFADCIEVPQEICTQDYFSAGIWSNIALCNIRMNKSDRTLKNAEKSYLKLKETDGKRLKHNVSSINMDLLCKAKKYDVALKVFEENLE